MAEYLDAIMGPQRRLPLIGDDDGGRLFFPCVSPEHYGQKESAPAILAALQADTPVFLGAALVATGDAEALDLAMVTEIGQIGFKLTGRCGGRSSFNLIHA